jgi:adenosylhomocysteinase
MTIQTAVLIETLVALGADVRWAPATSIRPRTTPPPRSPPAGIPVFAFKGETLKEYWDYTAKHLRLAWRRTANMILDDGGDATLFVHLGSRREGRPVLPRQSEERGGGVPLRR